MILIFGNPGLTHGGVVEQRCARLVSSRGDIGREHLRGEQLVLLFMATYPTGISRQAVFSRRVAVAMTVLYGTANGFQSVGHPSS